MIEEVSYQGWQRNLRLSQDDRELIITLDVGPRIIRFAFTGAPNLFFEVPGSLGKSGEDEWMLRGGHRLWTSPEGDHTYDIDNSAVNYVKTGEDAVEIANPANDKYGYRKTLGVAFAPGGEVVITHKLANISDAPLPYSIWALSVMAGGGTALIPQPAFVPHPADQPPGTPVNMDDFQPNRRLILWAYTTLNDPRFEWRDEVWIVRQNPESISTKFGLQHRLGWVAYQLGDQVFCKHIPYEPDMPYPDGGCNFELYSNREMLELESLAPARPLQPGETATHIERWQLLREPGDLTAPGAAERFFDRLDSDTAES